MMRVLSLIALCCAASLLISCGYSMPGTMNGVPDLSGMWTLNLAPNASSSSTTNLVVSFTQNGQMLTGNVISISNSASACLPASTSMGTFAVSGTVQMPQNGSNFAMSIMSTPSGSASSNAITMSGSTNSSYNVVSGAFSFASPASCSAGTFNMMKQ
jgi:hypothetical protein